MEIKNKKTQKALLRHRMRDRFLARLLAVMMAVTMMPLQSLPVHAEHITTVKSIKEIKDSYTVENGTDLDEIGLPKALSVVLETREEGSGDQEDKVSRVNVKKEVTWEGSYDGDTAGTYKLEAAFEDEDLSYKDMPKVKVKVSAPKAEEKEEESANQSKSDEEKEDEDEEGDSQKADKEEQKDTEEPASTTQAIEKEEEEEPSTAQAVEEEEKEEEEKSSTAQEIEEEEDSSTDQEKEEEEDKKSPEKRSLNNSNDSQPGDGTDPAQQPLQEEEEKNVRASSNSAEQAAEDYYGPNGTAKTFTVTLKDDKGTGNDRIAYAGEAINYNVKISMQAAATYPYDGQNQEVMFDKWDHITITMKLPENVVLENIKQESIYERIYQISEEENTWAIVLKSDYRNAKSANSINFDAITRIEKNGILADKTIIGTAEVKVYADFDVRIDEDGNKKTYDRTVSASTNENITLKTLDEWKVEKSAVNYVLSQDGKKVTVRYELKYGLIVGENQIEENDMNVYLRYGRVPYADNLKLRDMPSLILHNNNPLQADSITVTPAEAGYVYWDGTPADDGTKPTPIKIESPGEEVDLPYAVVGDNKKNVAPSAPSFSKYYVDMVYDYEPFKVWYYESDAANKKSHSKNTAEIDYQLKGQEKKTTDSHAEMWPSAYINPGEIEIQKYIVKYDGSGKALYKAVNELVTGPATYEIFNEDGSPATIYHKVRDKVYEKIVGNTVTINPSADESKTNGKDGTISIFLNGGTYIIKEVGRPNNTEVQEKDGDEQKITVNENGHVKAPFNNIEKLGEVKIKKTDDSANKLPLSGAKFGLYKDKDHNIPVTDADGNPLTVTTGDDGLATFTRLPLGDYYLYEISAPEDFVKSDESIPVEVNAGAAEKTYTVENHDTMKTIKLQKQYSTLKDPTTFIPNDDTKNFDGFRKFENRFKLQKSIDGETWEDVSVHSIDDYGVTSKRVPMYDEQKRKLHYRFVETIPTGYYSLDGNTGEVESDPIIPADGQDTIIMKNLMGGSIELTKKSVSWDDEKNKYSEDLQNGKTFKLYRTAGENEEAKFVKEAITGEDGKCRYNDLVSVDNAGNIYTYYVVEEGTDEGYIWETGGTTIKINGEDTPALKIGSFTEAKSSTLTATTFNIQQKMPIGIIKRNKLNDSQQLAGAQFTITTDGADPQTVVSDGTKAVITQIEVGHVYTIEETKVPEGYYKDADPQTIDTTGWKVKQKGNGYAVYNDKNEEITIPYNVTFKDTPYQEVRLVKKVKNKRDLDKDAKKLSNVGNLTFSVYVKNGDGFELYKDEKGNTFTIKADGSQGIILPKGTYYLHENNDGNLLVNGIPRILYPDLHHDTYENEGTGIYDNTTKQFYFGPYEIKEITKDPMELGIVNISNNGDLIVNKQLFNTENEVIADPLNTNTARNGFSMQVFQADENGNKVGEALQTVKTGETGVLGQAKFTNLPVYDKDGHPIKYIVEESLTDGLAEYYYSDELESSLSPVSSLNLGQTTSAGDVFNHPYIPVSVVKKYYDAREHQLTQLEYELEGAVIAIYRNDGEGKYTFVDTITTDYKGRASYKTLKYSENGYVAIEVSVPDKPEYKNMIPESGKYLEKTTDGTYPETLTQDKVEQLSRVELTSPEYTGVIYNVLPWTQIHITKYEKGTDKKLDGGDFTLYKQELDGTEGTQLTFDESKCTVVGQYTSGTWIQDGAAQKGEFQTDILEYADNIVYWLVETRAPSGYKIIPEANYVLFTKEGTEYTNNSNDGKSRLVYINEDGHNGLKGNKINYYDVPNEKIEGPDGTVNRAYIEFTKWRQKEGTAGKVLERSDFLLMPNATFKLYAANKNGDNRVLLLDTITTGDENSMQQGKPTTGYGVSKALDAWEIFDEIERRFPKKEDRENIITYKGHDADTDQDVDYPYKLDENGEPKLDANQNKIRIPGTFILNAVLFEESCSSKYKVDVHPHNMQITFVPSDLSLGNSKYAVQDIMDENIPLCDQNKVRRTDYEYNDDSSMAIVDYLSTEHSVVLRHFGYDPDPQHVGYHRSHEELETLHDQNPALFVSKTVTFALEKYNPTTGSWEAWDPVGNEKLSSGTNTFNANGDGYRFEAGLNPGEYRVYMTSPADGYENFYPEKYPGYTDKQLAFHFTVLVSDSSQTFTTYSPSKPTLTITKTDMDGNVINETAKFQLQSKPGNSYNSGTIETVNGKAEFKGLPADTSFKLSEIQAPGNYNNEYFAKLFTETYPKYANLVNGNNGYPISYTTVIKNNGGKSLDGSDLKERLIEDKPYEHGFTLTIRNLKNVSVKLIKRDSDYPDIYLPGAEFNLYYHAFDRINGNEEYVVPVYKKDDPNWKLVEGSPLKTGDNGEITKENLPPGIYYAVETKAPIGKDGRQYNLNLDGQTIVMTGELKLNIPESQEDKYKIFKDIGEMTFEDLRRVNMTVEKEVAFGKLEAESYEFTFNLYDKDGKKTSATVTGKVNGDGIDTTSAVFANLIQGETYYLEETPKAGYKIEEVKVDNKVISAGSDGKYPIKIEDGSDVKVSVKNVLKKAKVHIYKYDGDDGTGLKGASFEVLTADKEKVQGAEVVPYPDKDGEYTALIPLEKADGTEDFYIHETKAPEINGKKYTIDDNGDNAYIFVEDLNPGEDRPYKYIDILNEDNVYTMPNFVGIPVKIQKYGGLPENPLTPLENATFQMYFSTDGGKNWNSWHPEEKTNKNGEAEFLVLKGDNYMYAIAETGTLKGYKGLYGIYDEQNNPLNAVPHDGQTMYILGHEFENVGTYKLYTGYNIPFLRLKVVKEDLGKNVQNPNARFTVYEVPKETPTTLTEDEIQNLIEVNRATFKTGGRLTGTTGTEGQPDSTYTNNQFICPGKTYLAVEEHAFDKGSDEEYSIIKDDSRVVSYQVFSVPEKNYLEEYTVTFKNLKGNTSLDLTKALDPVDQTKIDSLTISEAKLTYTLTPNNSNSYALDSYTLTDEGLTVEEPEKPTLEKEWYNITGVIVGQGTMDKYLKGVDSTKKYPILAKVTFVDFNGNPHEQTPVNASEGNIEVRTVEVPEGVKIQSFFVEYYSPELEKDTGGYKLGQNFKVEETKVMATVFKQKQPAEGVVTEVKKIKNTANVVMKWTPWDSDGNKKAQERDEKHAEVVINVEGAKAPKIKLEKSGPPTEKAVELDSSITYTLTLTNTSTEENNLLDFNDPIIVDLLPQGMTVDQTKTYITVDKPEGIKDYDFTTDYAGDSQYVKIDFTGKLEPGKSIEVKLTAVVNSAVTSYGSTMRNYVFATSEQIGVKTKGNETGAVIKDEDGLWAIDLVEKAKALLCDESRAAALKTKLGEQGQFGYLGAYHENEWVSDNELICVKGEYGPSDGGVYRTDKVAVLVNNENEVSDRTMHYQLTINNLSDYKRTNMAVMDIMPVLNDKRIINTGRGSNWPLYFSEMDKVKVNGEDCTDYKAYYYSGDATSLDAASINSIIAEAKNNCPQGWTEEKPDKPTAIIVAFNYNPNHAVATSDRETVVLNPNQSVQIEYTAMTDYYKDFEELAKIVFTNAANDFNFGYSTFPNSTVATANNADSGEPLGSNVVEVTIAPTLVKVGGDVWIDANDNGIQDDEGQRWYGDFAIVKQLINDLSVSLQTSDQKNLAGTKNDPGSIGVDETGSNFGIAHFEFEDLMPAKLRNGSTDEESCRNWNNDNPPNANKLIGKNPYTYHLNMGYAGSLFTKTKNTVDPRGSYLPGEIPPKDQQDDNFNIIKEENSDNSTDSNSKYRSEQFFLHPITTRYDMTKDIGFNLKRKLELTKVSQSGDKLIEGAEFKIYGPFEHGTGKGQELTDQNLVATLTTDEDGKITKEHLQYFKEYVIVESKAASGFGIVGASVQPGTNTKVKELGGGKWLLEVPNQDLKTEDLEMSPADDGTYEVLEQIKVSNPENIKVEVEKDWDDEDDAYETRPESIIVKLYTDEGCTKEAKDANGNVVGPLTLDDTNSWKGNWTDLPKYQVTMDSEGKEEIKYYVKEYVKEKENDSSYHELKGYNVTIEPKYIEAKSVKDKASLTITNTPKTRGIKVEKIWKDELKSLDAKNRIYSVTFTVQRSIDQKKWENVQKKEKDQTLKDVTMTILREKEDQTKVVDGLPICDKNDNPYYYRAVETSMVVIDLKGNHHTIKIGPDQQIGGYKVTEVHLKEEKKEEAGQQTAEDQTGENPTAKEETLDRDKSEITNQAVKGKLKVIKIWNDENNRYGDRPTEIKVQITAKTDYFKYDETITLNEGNEWGAKLEAIEVPVKDVAGNEITYTITEILDDDPAKQAELLKEYTPSFKIEAEGVDTKTREGVTGETEVVDGKETLDTYTNTHRPVRTSVTAKKIWNDQNNKDGHRPKTIEFTLYETYKDKDGKDKTEVVTEDDLGNKVEPKEVTEGSDGTWTVSWSDLAVYKSGLVGSKITYTVKETKINGIDVKDYYGYEINEDGLEVTNTPITTGLDVRKEWVDTGDYAAKVTAVSFRVESSIDGSSWKPATNKGQEIILTIDRKPGETMGTAQIDGLAAYDENNNPLIYRAVEISIVVDGKTLEVSDGKVGGYKVTEKHTPGKDESPKKATAKDESVITNTLLRGKLAVKKEWTDENNRNGVRPDSITINLKAEAGGKEIGGIPTTATLNEGNGWTDTTTWADLPIYDAAGSEISYTLTESSTGSYKAYVTVKDEAEKEGSSAASTLSPDKVTEIRFRNELILTEFHVEKTFVDDGYDMSQEIKYVTVRLQRKSGSGDWVNVQQPEEARSMNLTSSNDWTHTWKGLPKYDKDGQAYKYRAIEVSYTTDSNKVVPAAYNEDDAASGTVGAYTYTSRTTGSVEEGFTTYIDNKLRKGSIEVKKQWRRSSGSDIPGSLTITLRAFTDEGEIDLHGVDDYVTLKESNDWMDTTTWDDLPVYASDGSKITYHLSEDGDGDYSAKYRINYNGEVIQSGRGETLTCRIYDNESVKVTFINKLTRKSRSSKTGDTTPILPYLGLFLASLAGIAFLLFRRRRRV